MLLDADGVTSKKGARLFTSQSEFNRALVDAGLAEGTDARGEEEEVLRAAISGA